MSLRTVADETPRLWRSTKDFEPIGSLVATKSATIARSTSKRRSSALPIGPHLLDRVHFTVSGVTNCHYGRLAAPAGEFATSLSSMYSSGRSEASGTFEKTRQ